MVDAAAQIQIANQSVTTQIQIRFTSANLSDLWDMVKGTIA